MGNMEKCQISASMNDGILEMVIAGELTDKNVEEALNEGNAIVKASKATKAIVDFRTCNTRLDALEFYRYTRNYSFAIFEIKYAVVSLPEKAYYREAAIKAGLKSLMWFTDMDEARVWLKSIQ